MKAIAFHGSPRQGGNTEALLDAALRPVRDAGHEVEVFRLNDMQIAPCQNCGGCDESGECIIRDDMDRVYSAIRSADRIILASPIFFFGVSAQVKTMIDRCQSFWCEKYLLKRPLPGGSFGRKGLLLLVGGMTKDVGVKCAGETAKAFFRTVSVPSHDVVSCLGVDARGAIREHPTGLRDAQTAGSELVR